MNSRFKKYALIWIILLIVFNVISFVVPSQIPGVEKFDGAFWTGYAFITVAFIGQLICGYIALKAENLKKLFYNMPLITISYTGLIIMLIVGAIVMAVPGIPTWVGIVVCLLVLAFTAIAIIKASWAADEVQRIDEKVQTQTSFVKNLTADVEGLVSNAKDPEIKAACKRIYEAVRYSDPMSSDVVSLVEAQITDKMAEFAETVKAADAGKVSALSEELLQLVADRNRKCKAEK